MNTTWQRADVALNFLDERRRNLPYGEDQLQLLLRVVKHFRPAHPASFLGTPPETGGEGVKRVVDLGCGDGVVARTLLTGFPDASAVLVDHSLPMLSRADQAMMGFGSGSEIVHGDLSGSILDIPGVRGADVIASAYAIHHLPNERKRSLYAEIFEALAPGGVFVNVEHVAPASARTENLWDNLCIENLVRDTGRPYADVAAEYHNRPDKADNILETVDVQTSWLREIGFVDVDCYFKFLELAVFGGVKPA